MPVFVELQFVSTCMDSNQSCYNSYLAACMSMYVCVHNASVLLLPSPLSIFYTTQTSLNISQIASQYQKALSQVASALATQTATQVSKY